MINRYTAGFTAVCPNNDHDIRYALTIATTKAIQAEKIAREVKRFKRGYHEEIADELHAALGGTQKLVAVHGDVTIETVRP